MNKTIITFLLIFFVNANSILLGQADKDVYKQVIKEYMSKQIPPGLRKSKSITLLVKCKVTTMGEHYIEKYDHYLKKYKNLKESTYSNFVKNNQKNCTLRSDDFNFSEKIKVVVVDENYFRKGKAFIYAEYPDWNDFIYEFSRIGFDDDKKQAFVYYSFYQGPGVAGGFYVIYEKKRKKWKQKGFIAGWAA